MTGNELITNNEEYLIRQQFLETFGGTTFKHLIEWFKSQKQGGRINISDFNLYPIIRSVKGYNNFISDAGYYLHFNKYRANLLIYVKDYERDKIKKYIKHDEIIDSIKGNGSIFASYKGHKSMLASYFKLKSLEKVEKQYDDYLPFKGIDTDMFTPVDEYQEGYNIKNQGKPIKGFYRESIIKNGILFKNDSQRIDFLKIIYEQLKIYLKFGENDYKKVSGGICLTTGRKMEGEFYAIYHKE